MSDYLSLFRFKEFIKLCIAALISNLGDALSLMAFPLFAYKISNTISASGIVLICETIPWIILGPFIGIFIDQSNRRKVMLISDLIRAILVGSLFFVSSIEFLFSISFLMGIFTNAFVTARTSITPDLLDKKNLSTGIALNNIIRNVVIVGGPSLGGLILSFYEIKYLFLVDSLTFIVSFILIFLIKTELSHSQSSIDASPWCHINQVKTFIREHSDIKTLLQLDFFKTIVEAIVAVLIIALIKNVYKLDDSFYGILLATNAIGILIGVYFVEKFEIIKHQKVLIGLSALVTGLVYFLHYFNLGSEFLLLLWFFYGLSLGVRDIVPSVVLAFKVREDIRGRFYSLANALISTAYISGYFVADYLVKLIGITHVFILSGIIISVTHLYILLSHKNNESNNTNLIVIEKRAKLVPEEDIR